METGLLNLKWGRSLMEVVASWGVREVVTSPGSRSTPLMLAACSIKELHIHSFVDERSAAFYALGLAKASGRPVALICTSGTAVANYYPAIIEASLNDIPLVVLTADRPPELRGLRVGQTIDQLEIYGNYVRNFVDLPVPAEDRVDDLKTCLKTAENGLRGFGKGPVQLNCPFREPLLPSKPQVIDEGLMDFEPSEFSLGEQVIFPQISLPERTLILAGPVAGRYSDESLKTLAAISNQNQWPILADASFPARHRKDLFKYLISHYDFIFRNLWDEKLAPKGLLIIGEPPTCKVLRQHFNSWEGLAWQVPEVDAVVNPMELKMNRFAGNLGDLEKHLISVERPEPSHFATTWLEMENMQFSRNERFFQSCPSFFEGEVYRLIANQLPDQTPVVVANSLAIRDVEWFWPATAKGFQFQTMRGANGIDGTLSYACGSIAGFDRPGILLTGDLAFLHDSNGLLQARNQAPGLLVVLLNNDGGGIFNMLPISKWEPPFEERFATPQSVDFKMLCQAHGVPHQVISKREDLELFEWTPPARGIEVLEIKIDRRESTAIRKAYFKSKLETNGKS